MEESHLTYYKLLDGLDITRGGKACDLSFNDFVTAKYLAEKNLFDTVYALTKSKMIVQEKIQPVKTELMIASDIRRLRVDSHVCLGGAFRFQPVHDVTYALHSSLNVGGRLVVAVYPNIYDSQGRDVLMMLSHRAHQPVKDKLHRWSTTVANSIHNLFVNLKTDDIISDTDIGEIISLFGSDNYRNYLFKNNAEFDTFFAALSREQKYYMSWKVLRGVRL
jgi:hypothetical protein